MQEELIIEVTCDVVDTKDVIKSIREWFFTHRIGMEDLKIQGLTQRRNDDEV